MSVYGCGIVLSMQDITTGIIWEKYIGFLKAILTSL